MAQERLVAGAGRPVVFVHAALLDGTQWKELIEQRPDDVRAVAVDLPDVGFDAPGTTLESLEAAFDAFILTKVNGPVTLVGHSLGAWVVARALSRLRERVERAVLISGVDHLPPEMARSYEQLAAGIASGAVPKGAAQSAIVDGSFGSAGTPELKHRVSVELERLPVARMVRTLRLVAALGEPAARVKPYSVPTTVLHGRGDRSSPLALGQSLADLGEADFEIVETDSHVLPLTHASRVAALAYSKRQGHGTD